MPRAILISPHPDDEVIGLGGTVAWLVRHGWEVLNVACGLGRPADFVRRQAELERATERLGIVCTVVEPPLAMSGTDDLDAAEQQLHVAIGAALSGHDPDLVIGPMPQDLHHGHEVVGRALRRAMEDRPAGRWWQYAIWGDLPFPTLCIPLELEDTERALYALGAYSGENDRNDYSDLLRGNWTRNRALASERVFGYGADRATDARAVDMACEVCWDGTVWRLGAARVLAGDEVLVDPSSAVADAYVASLGPIAVRPEASTAP